MSRNPTTFDMATAISKAIRSNNKNNKEEQNMTKTARSEYLAMIEELIGARVSLRMALTKINELHTNFTAIDFDEDSDEDTEEVEERISKLEDALEEFEDEESRLVIQNKIKALSDQMASAENTGELRDELKELFAEIAEELDDMDLDTD